MTIRYRLNGREVSEAEFKAYRPTSPVDYEKGLFPSICPPPDSGWEGENGGRGRYISQLQREPGPDGSDPTAFCRSQSEILEKAKRRGLTATRAR